MKRLIKSIYEFVNFLNWIITNRHYPILNYPSWLLSDETKKFYSKYGKEKDFLNFNSKDLKEQQAFFNSYSLMIQQEVGKFPSVLEYHPEKHEAYYMKFKDVLVKFNEEGAIIAKYKRDQDYWECSFAEFHLKLINGQLI